MPSNINVQVGATTVGANYLKASPSTTFGTRQLSIIKIEIANVANGTPTNADSLFSKSVRALQQTAEVWAIGTPVNDTTDYFQAIISTGTQWDGTAASQQGGAAGDGSFDKLETAIAAGNGGVAATVTLVAL